MDSIFRRCPGRLTLTNLISYGGASSQVANEFFEAGGGPTYYGILKRWTGAAWVKSKLKVWLGGSWIEKALKRWDGSEWRPVDTTGV